MICCMVTGQAAGTAAAIAAREDVTTSSVNVAALQATLKETNVNIGR